MKVTYIEQIENYTAYDRRMICANCGSHEFEIVELVEPQTLWKWFIRCPQCGHEGHYSVSRAAAKTAWREE